MRRAMRHPILQSDPGLGAVGMPMLVAIAQAVEHESVRRYEQLAQAMHRRGEADTASAFEAMLAEERGHVEAVGRWAAGVTDPAAQPIDLRWRLPADLSESWDEVAGSALLTPYRAFAIAADNEQRAFAFYSYLAAHADDARVAAEAERLATEELRHASLMRRWRRRAYHRERAAGQPRPDAMPARPPHDADGLRAYLAHHEAAIARLHDELADRLDALGDGPSATLLRQPASRPAQAAATLQAGPAARATPAMPATAPAARPSGRHGDADDDPVPLLAAAQKPLESLADALEAALASAQPAATAEIERALDSVIARLAALTARIEQRMRAPASHYT